MTGIAGEYGGRGGNGPKVKGYFCSAFSMVAKTKFLEFIQSRDGFWQMETPAKPRLPMKSIASILFFAKHIEKSSESKHKRV